MIIPFKKLNLHHPLRGRLNLRPYIQKFHLKNIFDKTKGNLEKTFTFWSISSEQH